MTDEQQTPLLEGEGTVLAAPQFKTYEIDFDKVNSIHDLKVLLQSFDVNFRSDYANIGMIQHMLREKIN